MKAPHDGITASEAGELLGVTRHRVYGLLDAGEFPGAVRFGWMWVIPRAEVEAYKAGRAKPTAPAESDAATVK